MHPRSYFALLLLATLLQKSKVDFTYGLIAWLQKHLQRLVPPPMDLVIILPTLSGGVWLVSAWTLQRTIRALLGYHRHMYEPIGKPSLFTKLWIFTMRQLVGSPRLYSLQNCLPVLPLPSTHDTIERYMKSVEPLFEDRAAYDELYRKAREFERQVAPRLQFWLWLKWLYSPNYVSDWWEEYIYLHGRSPIMVNSNFYAIDLIFTRSTHVPCARLGNIIYSALLYRQRLENEEIKPLILQGAVPLCSSQYERNFNTTRVPGRVKDTLVHLESSSHIAVYNAYTGRFYKLVVHEGDHLMLPAEIEFQLQRILEDTSGAPVSEHERHLAALTAGPRTPWAEAREKHFAHGLNRQSLDAIEQAAFFVVLSDLEVLEGGSYAPGKEAELDRYAKLCLHARCYDCWFDKSFTLTVYRNAFVSTNAEHSWADAPVCGALCEFCACNDLRLGYDENGHCKRLGGELPRSPPLPERLNFVINEELGASIESQLQEAEKLAQSVDMHLEIFLDFGKGFIKKCRVSPDAYIQCALQDQNRFCQTYESSMTRLYRDGRTETVRSCTGLSCRWVNAMLDPTATSREERMALLRKACDEHQMLYRDAMVGKGVDRHLFCLYAVSRYLGVDSPFLKEALMVPWRLSTSQTPLQQLFMVNFEKNPELVYAGGGFGPVADDGYGVSYMIVSESYLFFHISSKHTCGSTNSTRFGAAIRQALRDMRLLFEPDWTPPAPEKALPFLAAAAAANRKP